MNHIIHFPDGVTVTGSQRPDGSVTVDTYSGVSPGQPVDAHLIEALRAWNPVPRAEFEGHAYARCEGDARFYDARWKCGGRGAGRLFDDLVSALAWLKAVQIETLNVTK